MAAAVNLPKKIDYNLHIKPILSDLLASGRRSDPPRPWLGVTLEEHRGRVFVIRVTPEGPAAAAGIAADDLILGIAGAPVAGLADFYRKLWASGEAGCDVALHVLHDKAVKQLVVRTADRMDYLKPWRVL